MTEQLDTLDETILALFRKVRSLVRFTFKVGPAAILLALMVALVVQVQSLDRKMQEFEAHVQGQEIVNRRVHAELGLPEKSFAERLEAEYERGE